MLGELGHFTRVCRSIALLWEVVFSLGSNNVANVTTDAQIRLVKTSEESGSKQSEEITVWERESEN